MACWLAKQQPYLACFRGPSYHSSLCMHMRTWQPTYHHCLTPFTLYVYDQCRNMGCNHSKHHNRAVSTAFTMCQAVFLVDVTNLPMFFCCMQAPHCCLCSPMACQRRRQSAGKCSSPTQAAGMLHQCQANVRYLHQASKLWNIGCIVTTVSVQHQCHTSCCSAGCWQCSFILPHSKQYSMHNEPANTCA